MAIPATKDALKEHCLRALGKPVIDVNVDPDQCDDRVDDALQYLQSIIWMVLKECILNIR